MWMFVYLPFEILITEVSLKLLIGKHSQRKTYNKFRPCPVEKMGTVTMKSKRTINVSRLRE